MQKREANGSLGLSCLQKIIAVYMMLSYDVLADFMDQYIDLGESIVIESLRRFVRGVVKVFGDENLRSPSEHNTVSVGVLLGCFGSIDCMHWKWKNLPYNGWLANFR